MSSADPAPMRAGITTVSSPNTQSPRVMGSVWRRRRSEARRRARKPIHPQRDGFGAQNGAEGLVDALAGDWVESGRKRLRRALSGSAGGCPGNGRGVGGSGRLMRFWRAQRGDWWRRRSRVGSRLGGSVLVDYPDGGRSVLVARLLGSGFRSVGLGSAAWELTQPKPGYLHIQPNHGKSRFLPERRDEGYGETLYV